MGSKIVIDTTQLNRVVVGLKDFEKQMPAAAMSAVNRTLDQINTKLGRIVTKEYNIKVSDVKKTITKNKARKGNLRAFLKSEGRTLSFSHFRISQSGKKVRKVKVKVKKSAGLKQINTDPRAFVQTLNGKNQVLKRMGKDRYPVEVLRTLSVPQMIDSLNVSNQIQKDANEILAKRIEHEIEYRLKKVKAK
ncbi:phage tail protein [Paenibacillus crassostreae]|uniref:Phage tail protein n=1 Tax=Paenibacillus crassostreae TaxID=1763538 RepID=A0A167C585_9BACL|nr:phage tail protein [Paenibacillus crassostreae]AOZ91631.1 hypothetical protein LPB68_04965 [Paenibacillus crassostreae]OAB72795.1 hypothetical protein PNBC_15285 [Paenibacillus crassostreae]